MSKYDIEDSFEFENDILSPRYYKNVKNKEDYVVDIILNFINFNKELDKKKSEDDISCAEFYVINEEWMKNFLKYYGYEKILQSIQNNDTNPKKYEELNIKEKAIKILKNLNQIYEENNNNEFVPKKEKAIIKEYNNKNIDYFSEFILVDDKFSLKK